MRSKTKTLTINLLAIIVILAIVLCLALGVTYTTAECSEAQVSDNTGITTLANNNEDFSSYTDQQLPDKIDKDNISKYIPVDKFNKNGTTIFNGRNYGFVIYSDTKTNHVLLFKEEYVPHDDGDGYEVTLRVVYEQSFYIGAKNDIIYADSPYGIALSNIRFDNVILDSDIDNSITSKNYNSYTDNGAYYTQVRYENKFSYYDQQLAADTTVAVVSTIGMVLGFNDKTEIASKIISPICTVASDISVIYSLVKAHGNLWIDNSNFDTDIDFPLTRQGQLDKYGALRKDVSIDVQADKKEFLTAENGGGFARAIFRVMNDNRKDYYVNNRISFEVWRYNGSVSSYKVDESYIESIYSVTGTDCDKYGQIIQQEENFVYEDYQRISPMIKTNLFNFNPDQKGEYKFFIPSGYYLTVDGKAQSSNVVGVTSNGCNIGIASSLSDNIGDKVYSRLLPQDFYNGKIAFTNISIQKKQELNINDSIQVGNLAYRIESDTVTHNDIYTLDAGDNVDSVDLYITDNNLKVLAKAVKKDSFLYVNYPMKANNVYGVVCVNRSGEQLDLSINKESDMTVERYLYSDIPGLYYSFTPKYAQLYNATGSELYDEDMNLYPSEGAFLQADRTYYLHSLIEKDMAIDLSDQTVFAYVTFGEEITSESNFNEMFKFTAIITAPYCFADGTYDVYKDGMLIAENVKQCEFIKDVTYFIVKRQLGGCIKIYIDGDILQFGNNDVASGAYVLNIEEKVRLEIDINNIGNINVYDVSLNEIELNHGYLLESGRYYVILSVQGESIATIKEYLQEVDIIFYVDGNIYNDGSNKTYYYGKKATLPVPIKDRYNFNGWKVFNSDKLITNKDGVMNEELLVDELVLLASWTLRSSVMEINFEDGTSKWWTGDSIISQNPGSLQIEGAIIDILVNMKNDFIKLEEGQKQGYYLSTFDYIKTSTEGNVDYYEFTPIWVIEKYYIEFILPYGGISLISRPVYYGEKIIDNLLPLEAFEFTKNQELYYLVGWKLSATSSIIKFALGDSVIDLTPGYGSELSYDSNNDGRFDSTLIRLSAELEYVEYNVIINSKSYNVGQEGYNVGTLGSYGYTETNYYGHNVLLITPLKDKLFSFDGVITINDLMSYWRSGSKSVTVELTLVDQIITVTLSYDSPDNGNPTTYNGNQGNIVLKSTYVRTYKFNYWTVDNNRIDVLNYANLGINRYYSVISGVTESKTIKGNFSRHSIKPTSGGNYSISYEATYVDLSRYSLMVNMTFTVASSAEEVTFVKGNCSDTRIVVLSRNSKLVINFDDVDMSAKSNRSVIDADECPDLEIYSFNSVFLSAGEVNNGGAEAAILSQNLTLSGQNIYIYGGNQVAGYGYYGGEFHMSFATAGIKCTSEDNNTLLVKAKHVEVEGGKGCMPVVIAPAKDGTSIGEKGEDGFMGLPGGDGAVAIYIYGNILISAGSKLKCIGGAGGNGNAGKQGGKGGPGRNGSFGVTSKTPGNGGNGGDGGCGGDGARAVVCDNRSDNIAGVTLVDGLGGAGGKGGEGGEPGDPVKKITGTVLTGSKGRPGTDGISGETGLSTRA